MRSHSNSRRACGVITMALSCLAGTAHAEAEFQYFVIPLGGITGISQSAANGAAKQDALPYGGMINKKYADYFFDKPAQEQLIAHFQTEVAKAFPTSVIGGNQVIGKGREGTYAYSPAAVSQCNPSFKVGYKDAYAVAIGISRLSAYVNSYGDNKLTQVLVPVTYTIRFVKLDGASVIFSQSQTIYTQLATSTKEFFAPGSSEISASTLATLRGMVVADGLKMVDAQVAFAAKSFVPRQTRVSVIGRDQGYIVFDHGSEVGFSSGEEFDAVDRNNQDVSLTVLYATDQLMVAVPSKNPLTSKASNALRTGDTLEFAFTKQGRDDAKPTVMALQYVGVPGQSLSEDEVMDNALQAIVANDIGFKAPFNLIQQDPDFVRLKLQIASEAHCDSGMFREMKGFADNSTLPRQNPDLFMKLSHVNSPVLSTSGVGGVATKDIFSSAIALSLVDSAHVTKQAFVGTDNYVLDRIAGKGLSRENAQEISLKNASGVALKALLNGFSVKQKLLPVSKLSGPPANTVTLSEVVPLESFAQARLVRPLAIAKTGKTIYLPIPTSDARLQRPAQDSAMLTVNLDQSGDRASLLKQTDMLLLPVNQGNKRLSLCDPARRKNVMSPGLEHPSGFGAMLGQIVGTSIKGYDLMEIAPAYLRSVNTALSDGKFQSVLAAPAPTTPFCILPMEIQKLVKNDCAAGQCSGSAVVGSGVRVFEGENKVAESLASSKFDFSEVKEAGLSPFVGIKSFEQEINSISQHQLKLQ